MNESILNILNSTYYMSNKLIPLPLSLLFDCISIIEHSLHETKPNLPSNISTNWPLKGVLQTHVWKEQQPSFSCLVYHFTAAVWEQFKTIIVLFWLGLLFSFLTSIAVDCKIIMFFSNSGFFLQDPSAKVNTTSKVL